MLAATYKLHGHSERVLGAWDSDSRHDDEPLDFFNVSVVSYTPNPAHYNLRKQV
jgi:hypothetical protein